MSQLLNAFPIDEIRAQFPALSQSSNGKAYTYLDNPGGTQVPQMVIDAITDCLIKANANLGGYFETTRAAGNLVDEAHQAMADFVNANSAREIVFGQNMTSLTLHMARSLGRIFEPGDEVIITRMEHDANVTPWELMARDHGLEIRYLPFDKESYEFDLTELDRLVGEKTRLVCFNHASNMTGTINNVKEACRIAHQVGALVYVDSVQFAPHGPIDVQDLECDFLVCSAYKFFGPHISMLWARESLLERLEAYKLRAAADSLPEKFETGTLSHEAMAGAMAAVEYFAEIGRNHAEAEDRADWTHLQGRALDCHAGLAYLFRYEAELTERMIAALKELPGVTIRGISEPQNMARRVPTISLTVEGRDPKDLAEALAQENIFVWSGHNYAIEPAQHLGILDQGGVLRIGLAHYNTVEEVDRTVDLIRRLVS